METHIPKKYEANAQKHFKARNADASKRIRRQRRGVILNLGYTRPMRKHHTRPNRVKKSQQRNNMKVSQNEQHHVRRGVLWVV